jgi:hypothetical protein
VAALDGDRISVLSTVASAPGSRPEATLAGGIAFRIKVARCRRQEGEDPAAEPEAPRFLIDGRLIDATREARVQLRNLLEAVGLAGRSPEPETKPAGG